jgi:uncharacterized membrane protein YeaQ/YmgE (transglycosylase-associated protein family)
MIELVISSVKPRRGNTLGATRDEGAHGMLILTIIVLGMAAGWVAQLILGEKGSMGEALGAGLAGSFVGGLLASLVAGDGFDIRPSGLLGSVVGAVVVLAIYRAVRAK